MKAAKKKNPKIIMRFDPADSLQKKLKKLKTRRITSAEKCKQITRRKSGFALL